MYKIVKKQRLSAKVIRIRVQAPDVAKNAKPGQFIILQSKENSERLPFTIAKADRANGLVDVIFQIEGGGTMELSTLEEGDNIFAFVGPLGKPTDIAGVKKACVVGGGLGCAIALPLCQALSAQGTEVDTIIGFRNKDLVILEDEFRTASQSLQVMTDDGSYGQKGVVTVPLEKMMGEGKRYDMIYVIGPLIMMKFVVKTAEKYNVPTTVSMNAIMVDGTGMCGCCRLTVGGKMVFACVDGPDFDGSLIDFDEAMMRSRIYHEHEQENREEMCNLYRLEVQN